MAFQFKYYLLQQFLRTYRDGGNKGNLLEAYYIGLPFVDDENWQTGLTGAHKRSDRSNLFQIRQSAGQTGLTGIRLQLELFVDLDLY